MTNQEMLDEVQETFDRCHCTLVKKNSDYATEDEPFKAMRSVEAHGICTASQNILARVSEKLTRVAILSGGKSPTVTNESIADTVHDMIVHLALFIVEREAKR